MAPVRVVTKEDGEEGGGGDVVKEGVGGLEGEL